MKRLGIFVIGLVEMNPTNQQTASVFWCFNGQSAWLKVLVSTACPHSGSTLNMCISIQCGMEKQHKETLVNFAWLAGTSMIAYGRNCVFGSSYVFIVNHTTECRAKSRTEKSNL